MSTSQTMIEAYASRVQQLNNEMHAKHHLNCPLAQVSIENGRRYARIIIIENGASRSVHSFVDLTNGNILKAASWKMPAKGIRGNIADLTKGFNAYGAQSYR